MAQMFMTELRTLTARPAPIPRIEPMSGPRFDQHDEVTLARLMASKPKAKPQRVPTRVFTAKQLAAAHYCPRRKSFIENTLGDVTRILGVRPASMSPGVNHGLLVSYDLAGERVYRLTDKGRALLRNLGAEA